MTTFSGTAGRKTMRVYLYVGRRAHPIYREQLAAIPQGYSYVPAHVDLLRPSAVKQEIAAHGRLRQAVGSHIKTAAVVGLAVGGHVRQVPIHLPPDVALLHSGQFIPWRPNRPYVLDFEDIHVVSFYQRLALQRPWARRRLLRALGADACRCLLPWTDAARRGFLNLLGSEAAADLAPRVRQVSPAITPVVTRPRSRTGGPLRALFIGSAFLLKGGVEASLALKRARETHDVELDIVSFVPVPWSDRLRRQAGVRLHSKLPTKALQELWAQADVLLFPTHMDTFGFVMLEAFARALPVVAADHFAVPEVVEHGHSGLLVPHENSIYGSDCLLKFPLFLPSHPPAAFQADLARPSEAYVDALAASLARVAEDGGLYERLSTGALETVRTGPLSINHRRRALGEVYAGALA